MEILSWFFRSTGLKQLLLFIKYIFIHSPTVEIHLATKTIQFSENILYLIYNVDVHEQSETYINEDGNEEFLTQITSVDDLLVELNQQT